MKRFIPTLFFLFIMALSFVLFRGFYSTKLNSIFSSNKVFALVEGDSTGGSTSGETSSGDTGSGSEQCCFLKNTLVTLPDNTYKYIQDVRVGDVVKSFNPKTHSLTTSKVLVTISKTMPGYYIFALEDGTLLKVTEEHPILATNLSYPNLVYDYFIKAKYLKAGDSMYRLKSGRFVKTRIISRRYIATPTRVYNMTVDGNETLFANDVAVHNKACESETGTSSSTSTGGTETTGSTSSTSTSTSTSGGYSTSSGQPTGEYLGNFVEPPPGFEFSAGCGCWVNDKGDWITVGGEGFEGEGSSTSSTSTGGPPPPGPLLCNISGSNSRLPGQLSAYQNSPTSGTPTRSEVWWSPTDQQDWSKAPSPICSGGGTGCSGSITFANPGTYYVVGNLFDDTAGTKCSGNPFGIPAGWTDCGSSCRMTVTVISSRNWIKLKNASFSSPAGFQNIIP